MNAKTWCDLGYKYLDLGNYTDAERSFIEGIKESGYNPTDFEASPNGTDNWDAAINYNGLGNALYNQAVVLALHRGTDDSDVIELITKAMNAVQKAASVDERIVYTICDGIPLSKPKYEFMTGLKEEVSEREGKNQ